jgi:hypothetical protein
MFPQVSIFFWGGGGKLRSYKFVWAGSLKVRDPTGSTAAGPLGTATDFLRQHVEQL